MPQSPFYSTRAWRDARSKYLRSNPWCQICLRIGLRSKATEVDHIRTIESGGAPLDPRNFSGKCKMHHSQKTRVLDTPTSGRDKLVTTGIDGFPCYVEVRHNGKKTPRG